MRKRTIALLSAVLAAGLILRADIVTYTYDDAGRLTLVTYPNGSSISYTYDAAGNLTARTVTAATSSAKKPDPKAKPAPVDKSDKSDKSDRSKPGKSGAR